MNEKPEERIARYTTEEARAILARAIVIESNQRELLSLDELTAAAAEAGIDTRALQVAVAEHEQRNIREPARLLTIPKVLSRSLMLGAGLGLVNAGLIQIVAKSVATVTAQVLTTAVMLAALVISGSFSGADRDAPRGSRLLRFEVRTLGFFAGLGTILLTFFSIMSPHAMAETILSRLLAGVGLLWLSSSSIGGAVTLWRSRDSSRGESPGSSGPQLSVIERAKHYLGRQLKRWSDLLLRYSRVAPDQARALTRAFAHEHRDH